MGSHGQAERPQRPRAEHVLKQLSALAAEQRLSPAELERLRAAVAAGDLTEALERLRWHHASAAVTDAVFEGRLSEAEGNDLLDRLQRGEDPHALRRQLRERGIVLGAEAGRTADDE